MAGDNAPWPGGCTLGCAPISCWSRTAASTPNQAWDTAAAAGAVLLWRGERGSSSLIVQGVLQSVGLDVEG